MALNRSMYPLLLDQNRMYKKEGEGYDWVRIDKSTLWELSSNPQTETYQYIDAAADTTSVTGFQLSMPQEILLDEDNKCFRAVDHYFQHFYTGNDAIVPAAIAFPFYSADGTLDKTKWIGLVWDEATLMIDSLNTVDKKYNMTINYNGDPKRGYITKGDDGKFKFEESEEAELPTPVALSLGNKTPIKVKEQ